MHQPRQQERRKPLILSQGTETVQQRALNPNSTQVKSNCTAPERALEATLMLRDGGSLRLSFWPFEIKQQDCICLIYSLNSHFHKDPGPTRRIQNTQAGQGQASLTHPSGAGNREQGPLSALQNVDFARSSYIRKPSAAHLASPAYLAGRHESLCNLAS